MVGIRRITARAMFVGSRSKRIGEIAGGLSPTCRSDMKTMKPELLDEFTIRIFIVATAFDGLTIPRQTTKIVSLTQSNFPRTSY